MIEVAIPSAALLISSALATVVLMTGVVCAVFEVSPPRWAELGLLATWFTFVVGLGELIVRG